MGTAMGKLTAIQVKNLGPGMHGDGESLYLAVTGKGGRSWVFRYREAGRLRDMGLGSARDVPLADARRKAADLRRLRADGHDPLVAKQAAEARQFADKARAVTFCRGRRGVHQDEPGRLAQREACCAVGRDAGDLCLSCDRQHAGGRG